jgi:hypothetical protein
MDVQYIEIPTIILDWSNLYTWSKFQRDARSDPDSITLPNAAGVYKPKLVGTEERLTIGKASNLRMRVKQGLVKSKVPHSSGDDFRSHEDLLKIVIRWAITDGPSEAEEELHSKHIEAFGRLPKYTDRT